MSALPASSRAWQRLAALASREANRHLRDVDAGAARTDAMTVRAAGLLLDFSRQRADQEIVAALAELARACALPTAARRLFEGAIVNSTERRPALHTALRAPVEERPGAVAESIGAARSRMLSIAEDVRDAQRRGIAGRPFRNIVHVGIGGSHLGPALVAAALTPPRPRFDVRFLANIDGREALRALAGLDAEETLIVVVSKSFRTRETLLNAGHVRNWLLERTGRRDAVAQHFLAVTANVDAAQGFGIPAAACLPLPSWVGGRYSLWSAAGLLAALVLGATGFKALLAGAHAMDRHFREASLAANAPALLALFGVWNSNFLGAGAHAALPYEQRLAMLPAYLQQLEMESNGKSVRSDGSACRTHTAPLVWGGEETNGQHAFHQWLLQGTRACSVDFVAVATPGHDLPAHHRWLLANCLSQGQALARGREAAASGDPLDVHRAVRGNQPSTAIVLDALDPGSLGALLAMYEHKAFCQGVLWGVNPFDQWGVELGKTLADAAFDALGGGAAPPGLDDSAVALARELRNRRRRKPAAGDSR